MLGKRTARDHQKTDAATRLAKSQAAYLARCQTFEAWIELAPPEPSQLHLYSLYIQRSLLCCRQLLLSYMQNTRKVDLSAAQESAARAIQKTLINHIRNSYASDDTRQVMFEKESYSSSFAINTVILVCTINMLFQIKRMINHERKKHVASLSLPLVFNYDRPGYAPALVQTDYTHGVPHESMLSMYTAELLLWPTVPFCYYTQDQLRMQLRSVLDSWIELRFNGADDAPDLGAASYRNVQVADLVMFMSMAFMRFSEITCGAWTRCAKYSMHPDHPLDESDKYWVDSSNGMVPDSHKAPTVDITKIMQDGGMGADSSSHKKTSSTQTFTVSRPYVGEVLSAYMNLNRLVFYLTHHIYERHYIPARLHQRIKQYSIEAALRVLTNDETHQLSMTFEEFHRNVRYFLLCESTRITDKNTLEELAELLRQSTIMDYWTELFAYSNGLICTHDTNRLEDSIAVRIQYDARRNHALLFSGEKFMDSWIPPGARNMLVSRVIQRVLFLCDKTFNWTQFNVLHERDILNHSGAKSNFAAITGVTRSMPYVVQIGGALYLAVPNGMLTTVSGKEQPNTRSACIFFHMQMVDMEEAFALWLLVVVWYYKGRYADHKNDITVSFFDAVMKSVLQAVPPADFR